MGLPPTKPRACESHSLLAAMRSLDYPPHGDTLARQEALGRVEGDQTRRGVGDCSADPKKSRGASSTPGFQSAAAAAGRKLRRRPNVGVVATKATLALV